MACVSARGRWGKWGYSAADQAGALPWPRKGQRGTGWAAGGQAGPKGKSRHGGGVDLRKRGVGEGWTASYSVLLDNRGVSSRVCEAREIGAPD